MKQILIIVPARMLGLVVLFLAITSCSHRAEPQYCWVMSGPYPDSNVRVWISSELAEHKTCEETNVSPALALAYILNMIADVKKHKIHYHARAEDRGIVFTEYLADPKSRSGERRLGRDETFHYHGLYVDLDTAKELIFAVKANQHGAE